jgi:hypothetical protein
MDTILFTLFGFIASLALTSAVAFSSRRLIAASRGNDVRAGDRSGHDTN